MIPWSISVNTVVFQFVFTTKKKYLLFMIFPNLLGLLCTKFFQSSMSYYSSDFLEKENDLHMKTKHVTYE